MRYITQKDCFHNGRYYSAGQVVECDCKFCKEGSVSYFKKEDVPDEEIVSQETKQEEVKEVKEEIKEEIKEEVKPKKRNKIEII